MTKITTDTAAMYRAYLRAARNLVDRIDAELTELELGNDRQLIYPDRADVDDLAETLRRLHAVSDWMFRNY